MKNSFKAGLFLVTAPNNEEAQKIAEVLVNERLAACVTLTPVKSVYRWQGEIQKDDEVQLMIKSDLALSDKIIERIKQIHSYEVPEIVSVPFESGLPAYLNWIDEQVL
ncbi:MAG: divalent-cation tolerance protein CutA [Proteobacteria bacterium]|nr:divalent-cation tolerance protein CutA [Pseudomonadota bacterium]